MAKHNETTTWKIGHGVVVTAQAAKRREFLKAIKPTVDPVTTIEKTERARIRRAIAPALRELRTEESIMRHQGDQIRADVIKRNIAAISEATRAPRPARAKKGNQP